MERKLSFPYVLLFVALLTLAGLVSSPALAEVAQDLPPFDLASALAEPTASTSTTMGSCEAPAAVGEAVELAGPITIKASCTADCGSSPDVTCSASGSCTAVDRNCAAGQRGYVTCGSSTTYCPSCACTEGAIRYVTGSGCCCDYTIDWAPVNRRRVNKEKCVNGAWVFQSFSCSGQNCGGNCEL